MFQVKKFKVKIFIEKIKDRIYKKNKKDTINLLDKQKKIYNFSSIDLFEEKKNKIDISF